MRVKKSAFVYPAAKSAGLLQYRGYPNRKTKPGTVLLRWVPEWGIRITFTEGEGFI